MIHLEVKDEFSEKIDPSQLKRAVRTVLKHEGKSPQSDLSLIITDDDHLRGLNNQFRGIDEPTDVLSFTGGEVDPDTSQLYLGDVIISYPRAVAQSGISHSLAHELILLVVHGILHLLGYDHLDPLEKERMWTRQSEILSTLGVSIDVLNL